jgi:predicted Zn-dependent protease
MKRPSRKSSKLWLLATLLLSLSIGCATVPETGRRELILIPESQELALGVKSYQEILSKSKLSQDQKIAEMVRRVGGNVARVRSRDYPIAKDYQWEFNVIEDEKTSNAFALPGGKIAVYTGILKYTQNEAGLATVMSHEVAHALARHGGERMSQVLLAQLGEGAISAAVKNQSPEAVKAINIGYGAATTVGVLLPYSRLQESEADHIGLILMAKAGYDPREAIGFWERMAKAEGTKPLAFLSTHPTDEKRIAQIKQWMPEVLKYYRP